MITNRILAVVLGILAIPTIPVQMVTTLVLGIAVSLTFGLLMLPINLVWILLYCPMLGLSWLTNKVPVLREVFGILFLPWAVVAQTFVTLTPFMGDFESRAFKFMLCSAWPYTWEMSRFLAGKLPLDAPDSDSIALNEVVNRIAHGIPFMQRVIARVAAEAEAGVSL